MIVITERGPWRTRLGRDLPIAATIGVSIINGLDISPLFDAASFYLYSFAKASPLLRADAIYYLTSPALSLLTLLLAGVPAALYERLRGLRCSTPTSLVIWLVAAVLLTLPTLARLLIDDP